MFRRYCHVRLCDFIVSYLGTYLGRSKDFAKMKDSFLLSAAWIFSLWCSFSSFKHPPKTLRWWGNNAATDPKLSAFFRRCYRYSECQGITAFLSIIPQRLDQQRAADLPLSCVDRSKTWCYIFLSFNHRIKLESVLLGLSSFLLLSLLCTAGGVPVVRRSIPSL